MGRACSLRVATGGGRGLGVFGGVWDTVEPSPGGRSPHPAGAPRWGGSAGAPGHSLSLDVTSSNSSMSQRWGEGKRDPPGGPDHPQAGNALLRGLGARRELGTGWGGRSEGQELCPALGWSQPRSELQFIPEADGASGCVSRSLQDPFSKRLGLAGSLIDCLID